MLSKLFRWIREYICQLERRGELRCWTIRTEFDREYVESELRKLDAKLKAASE